MREASELPALQCCLLCGRTLTDRAAHDALEERVLEAIRAEHPDWESDDEACQPCVTHYRSLIKGRASRSERLREEEYRRLPHRLKRLSFQSLTRLTNFLRVKCLGRGIEIHE